MTQKIVITGKEQDRLLKKPEICKVLGLGRNKVYDLINSGEFIGPVPIPDVKIDLYSQKELQEWLKNRRLKRDEEEKLESK